MKTGPRIRHEHLTVPSHLIRTAQHALVALAWATYALSAFAEDPAASRLPGAPANFKIAAKQEGVPGSPAIRPLLTWRAGDQSNGRPIARFSIERLTAAPPPFAIKAWNDVGKVDGPNGASGRAEYSFVSPWTTSGVSHYRVCSENARGKVCTAAQPIGRNVPQDVVVNRANQYAQIKPRQAHMQQGESVTKAPPRDFVANDAAVTAGATRGGAEVSMIDLQAPTAKRAISVQMTTGIVKSTQEGMKNVAKNVDGSGGSPDAARPCTTCLRDSARK